MPSQSPTAAISTRSLTLEQKRLFLRRALMKDPHDTRAREALLETLTPALIHQAAGHGVYVCYHRADEVFALDVSMALDEARVRVWMDEMDVPETAEDWRGAVDAALRSCGAMLLILSPDLMRAPDVLNEYRRFIEAGKIVIPALHRACDYQKLMLMLSPVDFRQNPEGGLHQLKLLLGANARV
jgi:hypothetical protein